jgi:hypothetical protein
MPKGFGLDARGEIVKAGDKVNTSRGMKRIAKIDKPEEKKIRKAWFKGDKPGTYHSENVKDLNS